MNKLHRYIIGAGGGGKGGGSQRSPVEDKDSLRSRAYAKIVDVLGEGQIFGLANGLKSIYLDDVPLQNADGSYNFQDVAIDFRDGSIGQSALSNDEGSENTQIVNVELKYNVPSVRSIINAETDYCRVAIAVGALNSTDTSNGDVHGTSVSHLIEYRANGGAWQTVKTDTITGKTSSGYERTVTFKLSGSAPWDVRVTRKTTNSTSKYLQNNSKWTMLSEVIADKLRYPATALVGMQINAEQFSNIPTRAYDVKGLIVKVPSNYNQETRAYTGSWDGTFKMEWTNNPAWCLYDILLNDRYGLGGRIDAAMLDKWQFYSIAQYCDELVPDGHGGMEPRFTCNLYIQTRAAAYNFIRDMASIFRGITYWASGAIVVKQDASASVRYQFNNSNVENGIFDRAGSNIQTRHNVALVSWNDPDDMYRQKIEYVEDSAAIQRMGYTSEIEVAAFGCTSQGQARRYGEWLLYTELYENEVISFVTGDEGAIPLPNDVIQVSDMYHAGERRGGRVKSFTTNSITIDYEVTLDGATSYSISIIDTSGLVKTYQVPSTSGTVTVIPVSTAISSIAQDSTWVLYDNNLKPEIFRVVGLEEASPGKYKVSCLSHDVSKFAYIDQDRPLSPKSSSNLTNIKPKAKNVTVSEVTYIDKNDVPVSKLAISWQPDNGISTSFYVQYRVDKDEWSKNNTVEQFYDEIYPLQESVTYQIKVVAGNRMLGLWDQNPTIITYVPTALVVPSITNLVAATAWSTGQDVTIKWDVVNAKAYEVQVLEGATVRRTIKATESTCTYTAQDYKADGCNTRSLTFKVRAISANGRTGAWSQVVATNAQIGALQGIKVTSGVTQAFFEYSKPTDADFVGLCIWVDTTANFAPTDANKVFDGNDAVITLSKLGTGAPLVGGQTYYLRAAGYDTFGKDALAISASTAFSIYSVTSQIAELQQSQLNTALRTEIEKISGTGAGSVTARLSAESAARVAAINAESSARAAALTAEAQARQTADTTEKTERVAADTAANSRIATLTTSFNNNSAAVQTQLNTLSAADAANASAIQTVAAQLQTITTHESLSFDSSSNVADWVRLAGAGESSLAPESSARGGYVLRIGNNEGNDQFYGVHKNLLRVSDALIKITARWRRVSGKGGVYFGLGGIAADGVTWVNVDGSNTLSSQHYVLNNAKPTLGEWQTTVGYLRKGATGDGQSAATPRSLHAQVEYVRPVFLGNYWSVTGEVEFDYFDFEIVSASTLALVDEVKQSSVAGDAANASALLVLQTTVANNKTSTDAAITSLSQTSNSADTALGQRIDSVTATVTQNKNTTDAAITGANTARATADTALGQRIDAVIATANTDRTNANAAITAEQTARANADSALGTRVDTLTATVNSNNTSQTAAVQSEATARANADSAQASQITTLQTQTNSNTASIQTQANSINGLSAQYTVKTDVNGYVAGYGLATTSNNGTPTSAFIVNADKFGVGAAGKGTAMPFMVDTVNNKVGINGDAVVQGTLAASKLILSDSSNIYPDYDMLDAGFYKTTGTLRFFGTTVAIFGQKIASLIGADGARAESAWFPVESSVEYYIELGAWLAVANAGDSVTAGIEFASINVVGAATVTRSLPIKTNSATLSTVTSLGSLSVKTTTGERRARLYWTKTGATADARVGAFKVRRKVNDLLIVDGGVKTKNLDAKAVTAGKIDVTNLSAISADLGNITAGNVNLTSAGGSNSIRSNSKSWADTANGWIFAQNADGGNCADIRAGANRIWMSSWNDCGIEFPGIRMTNGGLTIDQLDVIGTSNLKNNSITKSVSVESTSRSVSASINLDADGVVFFIIANTASFGGNGSSFINSSVYFDDVLIPMGLVNQQNFYSKNVGAGAHTILVSYSAATGYSFSTRIFALGIYK